MPDLTAKRTIVKSPPELWEELSEVERLAKHLGAFGEIRITKLEPEHTVAWEGEHASGTVSIEPSGWGTKVTLTAELPEAEPPGAEPEADPMPDPEPEPEAEPDPDPEPPPGPAPELLAEEPEVVKPVLDAPVLNLSAAPATTPRLLGMAVQGAAGDGEDRARAAGDGPAAGARARAGGDRRAGAGRGDRAHTRRAGTRRAPRT